MVPRTSGRHCSRRRGRRHVVSSRDHDVYDEQTREPRARVLVLFLCSYNVPFERKHHFCVSHCVLQFHSFSRCCRLYRTTKLVYLYEQQIHIRRRQHCRGTGGYDGIVRLFGSHGIVHVNYIIMLITQTATHPLRLRRRLWASVGIFRLFVHIFSRPFASQPIACCLVEQRKNGTKTV